MLKVCRNIQFLPHEETVSTVLGIVILSIRPSVHLSVTRVLCDETKEYTADILISRERVTVVF